MKVLKVKLSSPGTPELLDRRNVGQFRQALVRGDRQRAQLAALDVAQGAVDLVDLGLHLAADDVGHGAAAALVVDQRVFGAGRLAQQLDADVVGRADARIGDRHLAGVSRPTLMKSAIVLIGESAGTTTTAGTDWMWLIGWNAVFQS